MAQLLTTTLARYEKLQHDARSFSAAYISQLLGVIRKENQAGSPLAETLTDRETDVLRLLSAGLSNREIADELVISLGTVKQYNHIIYRKLDVSNRKQAVERAWDLHLL